MLYFFHAIFMQYSVLIQKLSTPPEDDKNVVGLVCLALAVRKTKDNEL